MAKIQCYECDGSGKIECDCTGGMGKNAANEDCPACNGKGVHRCPVCDGTGRVKDED